MQPFVSINSSQTDFRTILYGRRGAYCSVMGSRSFNWSLKRNQYTTHNPHFTRQAMLLDIADSSGSYDGHTCRAGQTCTILNKSLIENRTKQEAVELLIGSRQVPDSGQNMQHM